ncbi:MAG: integrase [Nitrososphaerota archaeon]|nr:integrase [Nitrososphaerota archaeon]
MRSEHCKKHADDLISYAERYLPDEIKDQFELRKIYDSVSMGKRYLGMAIRNFLNFLETFSLMDEDDLMKYRRVIKLPKTKVDDYIPEDQEILDIWRKIDDEDYEMIFELLMYSGIRLIEAVELINTFDSNRLMINGEVAKYPLSKNRETKKILYVYMPKGFALRLRRIDKTEPQVRQYFVRLGLPAKYIRKWNYNFMLSHNIPESICDYIQGRAIHRVGGLHYLAKDQQATKFYEKIIPQFPRKLKS